ncbi:hypothetical protein [Methylobacterium sp. Leaf100]|uniref:hypothetical protein n=1 Tax=Methylobacterium sp. Leaf100 TaxID=1736252 RepID=UPI0007008CD8|nr:hypothetical protein [Methylobacterium sp. Leaf100]KQP27495.1 hypothetical protein ASF25_20790 [Methylobacterium sp. Leaf100]
MGARAIINGTDKADLIAGYFRDFRAALLAACHSPGGITVAIPTPPVTSKPVGPLVTPAPRNSGIVAKPAPAPAPTVQTGSLGSWLASLFTKKAS